MLVARVFFLAAVFKVRTSAAVVRALPKPGDSVSSLENYLLERGWPDDQRFESAFLEFPLYERGYTHEVLEDLNVREVTKSRLISAKRRLSTLCRRL
jgi:hypothetical protein